MFESLHRRTINAFCPLHDLSDHVFPHEPVNTALAGSRTQYRDYVRPGAAHRNDIVLDGCVVLAFGATT